MKPRQPFKYYKLEHKTAAYIVAEVNTKGHIPLTNEDMWLTISGLPVVSRMRGQF